MPLVPYPARFARHLPHAGKALSIVILFLHVSCIRFDDARKATSSYRSLPPPWGKGTAQRRSGALVNDALETISPRSFSSRFPHPTSAPSGHLLPEEGGSVHASPFPWKGLPSAARRGWLPFGAALGCSRKLPALDAFPTLFHTASTLSGSLRSPPSPRGEGCVRRYSFSPHILYSL